MNQNKYIFDRPYISAGFFVLLGIFGFALPNLAAAFVGLKPISAEGVSEMRATLSGMLLQGGLT